MFYDITRKLRNGIAKRVANGPRELDILDWFSRTALELIGVTGMGHLFEGFEQDTSSAPFTKAVKDYTPALNALIFFEQFLPAVQMIAANWIKQPFVEHTPSKRIRWMTHIADILHAASVEILGEKRRDLKAGDDIVIGRIGEGKEIISYLLRANRDAVPEDRLSDDEVLGQVMTFLFAAFDTTSSSLSIVIHLLSKHMYWQRKLRSEVTEVLQDGDIPFEVLDGLPCLDAVCCETLRLYAPVSSIIRRN